MNTVDAHIPISVLISRLEKYRDAVRGARESLPWYAWRDYNLLLGAEQAYTVEINAALELAASTQPFFRNMKKKKIG